MSLRLGMRRWPTEFPPVPQPPAGCQDSREAQAGDMDSSVQAIIGSLLTRASVQDQALLCSGQQSPGWG